MEDHTYRQNEKDELIQEGEEDTMDQLRGFKQVDIGSFHLQKSKDRFPRKDGFPPPDLPEVAEWRNNLCALSQRSNLFFAVCGDEIHVTIPKTVEHRLPGKPDLVIPIPATLRSFGVEGDIDLNNGHYANHIICGNLGSEEIILLSCDDGDVVAFYTSVIWNQIKAADPPSGESEPVEVKPLFHENVGVSAWGLAIHEKSRLIAVSTNHSQVVLFGFATMRRSMPLDPDLNLLQAIVTHEVYENLTSLSPLAAIDHRYNGYKFTYNMGVGAHNIPSIAFVSDAYGDAELILASDVRGNLWKVKLWETRRLDRAELLAQGTLPGEWGWCVLVLPPNSFKLAPHALEALGLRKISDAVASRSQLANNGPGPYIDLSHSVLDIIDPTTIPSNLPGMFEFKREPAEDSESDEEILPVLGLQPHYGLPFSDGLDPKRIKRDRAVSQEIFRQLVNAVASQIHTYTDWQRMINRAVTNVRNGHDGFPITIPATPESLQASEFHLPSYETILRTFGQSVQLIPPIRGLPRTICTHLLSHPERRLPEALQRSNRLNMCLHIAPLHLVVAASQAGEAAILSLTRMESGFSGLGPVVGFRVEYLIPFIKHLPRRSERKVLLGIAASRVVGAGGARVGGEPGGERWRILMYFGDHSVVSYEVWRGGYGDVMII